MDEVVGQCVAGGLDLECSKRRLRDGSGHGGQGGLFVRLVSLRHALPDPHADVEQVSLHLTRQMWRKALVRSWWRCGMGVDMVVLTGSGNRIQAPQRVVVERVAQGEVAGDARLELSLAAVFFGRGVGGALHSSECATGTAPPGWVAAKC